MTDAWTRLCELLEDDPEIVAAVTRAAAADADPWLVLIDGLDQAGVLAYLDPQDSGMELADALAGVPRVFRAGVDLEPVADIDGDLSAAITRADAILAPQALRIVYLAEEPDAYPLVVVSAEHAAEIVAVATSLGREARIFG